jgi:hypothetical protein
VELEYEIKLPQFLIDYAEKTSKKEDQNVIQYIQIKNDDDETHNEVIGEDDENDPLINEETTKINGNKRKLSSLMLTPIPSQQELATPYDDKSENDDSSTERLDRIKKQSDEEKMYNNLMDQYKSLFNEGKINELEKLIDNINKSSNSIEYKFNFTFDKYKYGEKKVSFIVRCIDNKNDFGKSEEESAADFDPKNAKYKKEKADAIKPLFELYEEERKEILGLPEIFLNLSIENKKFQKLLQACKNDINILSKTHGQKKDEVLEDENSSQSSQTGFDSGLVKKNRIEEIRNNLMKNISNYPTLKYIKNTLLLIFLATVAYIFIFVTYLFSIHSDLFISTKINLNLF